MRALITCIAVALATPAWAEDPEHGLPMSLSRAPHRLDWFLTTRTDESPSAMYWHVEQAWIEGRSWVRLPNVSGRSQVLFEDADDVFHTMEIKADDFVACTAAYLAHHHDSGSGRHGQVERISAQLGCPTGSHAWDERGPYGVVRSCATPIPGDDPSPFIIIGSVELDGASLRAVSIANPDDGRWERELALPLCVRYRVKNEPRPWHTAGLEFVREPRGTAITITQTLDGQRDGAFYVLYPGGSPAVMGGYKDDLEHGLWGWLAPSGELVRASAFIYGVEYPLVVAPTTLDTLRLMARRLGIW